MSQQLIELISSVLNISVDVLDGDSGPLTCSVWDSLAHMTIVAAIENFYSIKLSMKEIVEKKTINELSTIINERCERFKNG